MHLSFPNPINRPYRLFKGNRHDIALASILIIALVLAAIAFHGMLAPDHPVAPTTLGFNALCYDSLRTTMRLVIGMLFSLLFALIFGTWAAKSKRMERAILPWINFMESIPVLGFLTVTTTAFIAFFPHSMMGLEAASIFAVFTAQAWNMALLVYQTLRVIPEELDAVAQGFKLSPWLRFWRLELPYCIPGLLWNTMVSQSTAWFALVASETIPVGLKSIALPGIGSYIGQALVTANINAILWAIIAMVVNIVLFDQLLFRPLVDYAERFKFEHHSQVHQKTSWMRHASLNSLWFKGIGRGLVKTYNLMIHAQWPNFILSLFTMRSHLTPGMQKTLDWVWYSSLIASIFWLCALAGHMMAPDLHTNVLVHLMKLAGLTTLRVAVAMLLSIIIFVPLGIVIGLRPKLSDKLQPLIQIAAALPPDIFFPLCVIALAATGQTANYWSIALIMLGTQWYVLFNVIAGTLAIPTDLIDAAKSLKLKGRLWWWRCLIPAVFPYIVTGIISAAGGAWNADIAAEMMHWGSHTLYADGLGAYIAKATDQNAMVNVVIGLSILTLLVAVCIRFIWRPLYQLAENKYRY